MLNFENMSIVGLSWSRKCSVHDERCGSLVKEGPVLVLEKEDKPYDANGLFRTVGDPGDPTSS